MARRVFPSEGSRLAYSHVAAGSALLSAAGDVLVLYTAESGGSVADITDTNGNAISGAAITIGSDSRLPLFYGPNDGTDTLWAEPSGSSSRYPVYAREDDRLDSLLIEGVATASAAASYTISDVPDATVTRLTLTGGPVVLTFPAAAAGKSFTLELVQDGTGGRTVTWPGAVRWSGGTTPTLTTTASKRDVFTFLCTDGSTWLGFVAGQDYAA